MQIRSKQTQDEKDIETEKAKIRMAEVRAKQTEEEKEIDRVEARVRMEMIRENKSVVELDYRKGNIFWKGTSGWKPCGQEGNEAF